MNQTIIKQAGPYTISTAGGSILCNGKPARILLPLPGDTNRTGELIEQFVETGCFGANGRPDIVALLAPEWQVHLDAVASRRKAERHAWESSEAGKVEAARVSVERAYDVGHNEAGEGYNPHRNGAERTYAPAAPRDRHYPEGA